MHPKATKDKVLCPTAVPTPGYLGPVASVPPNTQTGGVWLPLRRQGADWPLPQPISTK